MTARRATHQLSFGFDQAASREPGAGRRARDDEHEASPRIARTPAPRPPIAPRLPAHAPETVRPDMVIARQHAERLAIDLRALVGGPVRLHVHDNRSTMVSFRRDDDLLHLRVHHMFLGAGPDVVRALAEYARARSSRAGKVLDLYVRQNRGRIRPLDVEQARAKPLRTEGAAHDLADVLDGLNERYFGGSVDARIGWGRGTTGRRRRSIRMGAYYHDTATILIHPALDRVEVPRFFVELVVYHEMLHQAVPQQRSNDGRRCIHSPEFRERERLFHDFERARAWERRNLSLLLRPPRARDGRPSRT